MRLLTCENCSRPFEPKPGSRGKCANCQPARERGSAEYERNRGIVLARAHHCHWCGGPLGEHPNADHVIPKAHGGTDAIENLVPSCESCNKRRGARVRRPGPGQARRQPAQQPRPRRDVFGPTRLS